MLNLIFRYKLVTTRDAIPAGHYINTYWNDDTNLIEVYEYDDAVDPSGTLLTSGPDIGSEDRGRAGDYQIFNVVLPKERSAYQRSLYNFCDGNDLNTFTSWSLFPYARKSVTVNHASCSMQVCDLTFTGYESTVASDSITQDGTVTVSATGTNGVIKYSTNKFFDYATEGQESGLFTGLLSGNYTIYAKDAIGCFDEIDVTVGLPLVYGVKYRLEYTDRNNNGTRVDVLQRGYVGDVIEVCGNEDPFILSYNGDGELNKFTPIIPSQATLTLISTENFYFIDLFSQDDRKYQVQYFKDFGIIQEAGSRLQDLEDWTNDNEGGTLTGPDWTLGTAPSVTVVDEEDSVWLRSITNLSIGIYQLDYDIDVATNISIILIQLFSSGELSGSVSFVPIVGNNTGSLSLSASALSDEIKVKVIHSLPDLPALTEWQNFYETSRVAWTLGATPTVSLTGVTGSSISQAIYGDYNFIEGQNYTIEIDLTNTDQLINIKSVSVFSDPFDVDWPSFGFTRAFVSDTSGIVVGDAARFINSSLYASGTVVEVGSNDFVFQHSFVGTESGVTVGFPKGASTVQFTLRDDLFNITLPNSPVAVQGSGFIGSYTYTYSFTAPANSTKFAIQITSTTGRVTFTLDSVVIANDFTGSSSVTINLLSIEVPEISGFQLKWKGFVISANYSEAYIATPYPVTIVATDGLADLDKFDFLDPAGNKFIGDIVTMSAVTEILKKTDLELNILTAVNRLEESMTDNALTESKFDAYTFYHDDKIATCYDALTEILKIFAVRIYQRHGKWILSTIEEAVHEFAFDEFDLNGNFIGYGTINDTKDIQNPIVELEVAFKDRDQTLEIVPSYGVFQFEHTLLENPSLVKSYSFETEDVYQTPEGITSFRNWNVNIAQAPGSEYGIKETKSFEGNYNFYWKVPGGFITSPGATLTLTSIVGILEYGPDDLFEYRFSYAALLRPTGPYAQSPLWVKLKWSLRVGDYYFNNDSGGWVLTPQYNDIYIDAFNTAEEYKIVAPVRDTGVLTTEDFQVNFIFNNERVVDFESTGGDYSSMDAISTTDKLPGYKIKGKISYNNSRGQPSIKYLYWELSAEDTATDGLLVRRPNDYDVDDNQKVWVLVDEHIIRRVSDRTSPLNDDPKGEFSVSYYYLDNVVLRLLPNGTEPPKNITLERINNVNIKVDYSDTFLLNDIDIVNINNSERTYKNFFKKLNGDPTQVWERTYRSGTGKLLELYSDDFLSQYKRPGYKLTGSFISAVEVNYSTILRELFDGGRKYMFMGYELHDKLYAVTFDLSEIKDVVSDDTSEEIAAGFTSGFSLGFNA